MKKTFQKTLIAAAAGVALMSAVGTASANSLLFPYFTTATGAQSVLSLSANNTAAVAGETLHYVYNYGSTCTHFDGNGKLTQNDLLQHSIAATTAGGFGKAVSTDASTPFYFPLANSYGFLTVTNKSTVGAVISGDMAIVDPSTGLVASYAGISNDLETVGTLSEGDYSGVAFRDEKFDLRFFGSSVTSTSWYGVVTGNMYAAITAGANWTAAQTLTNNGVVYNNDESPISGTATKTLNCAGSFTANDLMNTAQQAAVGGNGGLIHATGSVVPVGTGVGYLSSGLILMKLQAVQAAVGAPFAGKQFLHREAATPF